MYFVGPLSQAFSRGALPDSNSRPVVYISSLVITLRPLKTLYD